MTTRRCGCACPRALSSFYRSGRLYRNKVSCCVSSIAFCLFWPIRTLAKVWIVLCVLVEEVSLLRFAHRFFEPIQTLASLDRALCVVLGWHECLVALHPPLCFRPIQTLASLDGSCFACFPRLNCCITCCCSHLSTPGTPKKGSALTPHQKYPC